MNHYLLSVHMSGDGPPPSMTPEQMEQTTRRVLALEADMKEKDAFVFGGALHGPDAATVVSDHDGDMVMTDGPYAETKEHIGGLYVIRADDLDAALTWAGKVVETIGAPIEVRPFRDLSP